ncbi:hypothetical protein D3C71_2197210 [compost metagenome]
MTAVRDEGRLAHQQEGLAAEQRAVVVGALGEHHLREVHGLVPGAGLLHDSQCTQAIASGTELKWRMIAK